MFEPELTDNPIPKKPKRRGINSVSELDRPMVAWDGEGQNLDGPDEPQSLVLFGASTGDMLHTPDRHPTCEEVCAFICEVGRKYPTARHVGFGFSYDGNMIVRSLPNQLKWTLSLKNEVWVNHPTIKRAGWNIRFVPRKWFHVTEYFPGVHKRTAQRYGVRIEDIMTSYNGGFVTAMHDAFGCSKSPKACGYACVPDLPQVAEGKKHRGETTGAWTDYDYICRYHSVELDMLRRLAEKARADMWAAGFKVRSYHGPAVPARYVMGRKKVKQHMDTRTYDIESQPLPEMAGERSRLGQCARAAYMAGRFEQFLFGRIVGPFFAYDINSAHPFGMSQLRSMAGRKWRYESFRDQTISRTIDPQALYNVRHEAHGVIPSFAIKYLPQPLWHRDLKYLVSFPTKTWGWFWGIEVQAAMEWAEALGIDDYLSLYGRWVTDNIDDMDFPFDWIPGLYDTRRILKTAGDPAAWAMKLAMNSSYGLTCQTVGWREDEPEDSIPTYHQLEWAGWITAHTRSMLLRAAVRNKLSTGELIAFETDSIMTTRELTQYVELGPELGQWSRKVYDEGFYLQSGMGAFHCIEDENGRSCDKWEFKSRGIDKETFTIDVIRNYVRGLPALSGKERWDPLPVSDTRFITLGARFPRHMSWERRKELSDAKHCRWETMPRDIHPGTGKRIHVPGLCGPCTEGTAPWDEPHPLIPAIPGDEWFQPTLHPVPWQGSNWADISDQDDALRREDV